MSRMTLKMRAASARSMVIGFAVFQVAACLWLYPASANAQGVTQAATVSTVGQSTKLGNIEVVGSRIPRTSIASARPVIRITRKQIAQTGLVNLGQVLQRMTSSGSAVSSRIDVGGNGTSQLSLRNLGAKRLLVLVNGKRWIKGINGAVNLDQIPTSDIQRIEVLQDGASAIYGSDAIAGVVNVITLNNYNGAEVSAYYGLYDGHGAGGGFDGQTQQYSITFGQSNDQGGLVFNVQYRRNNAINSTARTQTSVPYYGTPIGSSITPQGRFEFYAPPGSSLYNNPALCPPDSTGQPFCDLTIKTGTNGQSISDYRPFNTQGPLSPTTPGINGTSDYYNYQQLYDAIAPNTDWTAYLQGHYQLTDSVDFHSTFMEDKHTSIQSYSPNIIGIPSSGLNVTISKNNPYNPFGFDLNPNVAGPQPGVAQLVFIGRRPLESGFRNFEQDTTTSYYNGGLDGQWSWGPRLFDWNVNYIFGHILQAAVTPTGEYNLQRMGTALSSASACQAAPGCVPLNLFGGQYQGGTITPAMLNYFQVAEQSRTTETLKDFEGNIASGDIATLPGGPLGFAFGAEHRIVSAQDIPNSLSIEGISTDGASSPTSGSYNITSYYGELKIPIINKVPFAHSLSLDVATRHSRFSNFGVNNSSQAGLKWQPTHDLLIRASWGQGFRAPDVSELFQGTTNGFPVATDPCDRNNLPTEPPQTTANCRAGGVPASYVQSYGEVTTISGGNPNLDPEHSISETAGFVYSPSQVPGLDVEADYYKITVQNLVTTVSAQDILNGCYVGGDSTFCNRIQRFSSGNIKSINDRYTNLGSLLTEGIDIGARYHFTTPVGEFTARLQSTFLKVFQETIPSPTGGAPTVYRLAGWDRGRIYPGAGYPKNKTNFSLGWDYGSWSLLWRLRYIGQMLEDCTGFASFGVCSDPKSDHLSYNGQGTVPTNHLGSTTYQDVVASYTFSKYNTTLRLGVNNLWNKEPPLSYSAHNLSYDPTVYDFPGRYLFLQVSHSF